MSSSRRCLSCIYCKKLDTTTGGVSAIALKNNYYCDFINMELKKRGCLPGDECGRYIKKKRTRKKNNTK